VFIFPNPEILRADPPLGQNRRGLTENEPGAADRAAPEVHEVPVVRKPVLARILAHRRDDDAVAQLDAAEAERRKEVNVLVLEHANESHSSAALAAVERAFKIPRASGNTSSATRLSSWMAAAPFS
jgi:hypothetical protein